MHMASDIFKITLEMIWNWKCKYALPSSYLKLQTTLPKYPTVKKADCFVVNGWQSKWSYVLERQQGKPSRAGSGNSTLQIGGHSFQCSSVSVSSGNLHNLEVMEERTQMGKQASKRETQVCAIYIFRLLCYHEVFLKSAGILWKDPALCLAQR